MLTAKEKLMLTMGKPGHYQYVIHKGWSVGALAYVWRHHLNPPEDWRNHIRTSIPVELLDICRVACEFFTATSLQTVGSWTGSRVEVEAIGYHAGPCG